MTDRFPIITAGLISDGMRSDVNTHLTYRMARATQRVALVFGNLADFASSAAPNNITVRAAVRVNGGWVPVFFHGRRDVVIEPDALVSCDPIGAPLGVDGVLQVRTRVSVTLGERWVHNILTDNAKGEGTIAGTTGADLTLSGTITANRAYGYGPHTVIGDAGGIATLVGIGDSIMQGQSDRINAADSPTSTLAWGYARRFAWANHAPFLNLGVIGDTARDWAAASGRKYALRRALASDASVALISFGVDDLAQGRTVAQIKANLETIWTSVARVGVKAYQSTITPMTAVDGVTPQATEPLRLELNNWIRTQPSPLTGFVDLADAAETARNSKRNARSSRSGSKESSTMFRRAFRASSAGLSC
ncbi:SGNH/GDSL hydrolase family protein [Microbacterium sp. MYb62]|uniref:SGNH/GDSL hydrolase family protein n=1 Tax=Microbacterium sp. MYb62 TaxID=1848690 RepID=UPI000CFD3FEE|nr:SGNH/GDSL hydrolase family protein [Microbacterium sp. MYb62]PRB08703.1 hypothetical protein CQ042_19790 [Microbacterium sp. MYb62]